MNELAIDSRQCTLPLTAEPRALSPVRRIIGAQLDLWGLSELTDLAQLAVTELLTNVIRHACDPRCTVVIRRQAWGGVEIAVHDCDPWLPTPRVADDFAESGRGLAILGLMTDGLHIEPYGATGKVIRCELGTKETD